MKYIISKSLTPILFSEGESHSDVASGVGGALSAGFVNVNYIDGDWSVEVYGESVSLGGMKPDDKDSQRIKRLFSPY